MRIPCAWLRQYDVPVEIQELSIPSSTGSRPHSSSLSLFSADVPVIICNPITYPLSALLSDPTLPLNHGNAILVLTSSPTSSEEFSEYTSKQFPPSLTVLFADPARAVRATQMISSNPGSAAAVQQYQDGFTGSRLSDLTLAITKKLAVPSGNVMDIHTFTARELTKCALIAANLTLKEARREVDEVTVKTIELQDAVAVLDARLRPEILGADAASEVSLAMDISKRQVQPVMSRLTWWRLVWRVDDVGETVGAAVDQAWCRQLENKVWKADPAIIPSQSDQQTHVAQFSQRSPSFIPASVVSFYKNTVILICTTISVPFVDSPEQTRSNSVFAILPDSA